MQIYTKKEISDLFSELKEDLSRFEKIDVRIDPACRFDYRYRKTDTSVNLELKDLHYMGHALLTTVTREDKEHEGHCLFSDFGMMIDVARNGVLRTDSLKKMIRYASYFGYHHVGLYLEDVLKVCNEPYFGYMRGAYRNEEIREIVSYAKQYGIEIRPYIQTLAHYNQITRYQDYFEHIDTDDILLCEDERVYTLIDNIFHTLRDTFDTHIVNIGMDEAMMVGRGKYLDSHPYRSKTDVMLKHLQKVLKIASNYGFSCQMYSDMFIHAKEKVTIEEDVRLMYWDYYSTDVNHYVDRIHQNKALSPNIGMISGAWRWTGFFPHNHYATNASCKAIEACKKCDIDTFVMSMWGDDGAECSVFAVLATLFATSREVYGNDVDNDAFCKVVGIDIEDMYKLDEGNPYVSDDTHNNASKYVLYDDVLMGIFESVCDKALYAHFQTSEENFRNLYTKYARSPFGYLFESAYRLMQVTKEKCLLSQKIYKAYVSNDKETLQTIIDDTLSILIKDTEVFYQAFKKQWMRENKSFGFEVQTVRLGGLVRRLKDVREILQAYCKGEIESIDILEEERLPFGYVGSKDRESLNYNIYKDIVSPGVM